MRIRRPKGEVKKNCSKCGGLLEENRLGKYRYCKSCHNEHMRLTRKKDSELPEEQKKKASCRSKTKVYISRGNLVKEPCYNCGNENVQAHHSDYDNPLKVHWLCRECHLELHSNPVLEKIINSVEPTEVLNRHPTINKILFSPKTQY